jgi:hypothetical protein
MIVMDENIMSSGYCIGLGIVAKGRTLYKKLLLSL